MRNELIKLERNSFFEKMKALFRKIFFKTSKMDVIIEEKQSIPEADIITKKQIDFCQGTDRELLDLQKKYHSGEIKVKELTTDQIKELLKIYNKQNKELSMANEVKKQKLLRYREKMRVKQ